MTERIPQSTAELVVFKAYLASDHVTEATGKTIAITISKNGGAFGNPNAGATNATEISGGWYKVSLDTTDTGTLGPLAVRGAVATIDDVGVLYKVVSATNGGMTNLDAAISSRMATYTQPTGFLAASFPTDPADQSLVIAATDAIVAAIAALNNLSSAQAQTAAAAALTAYDPPTKTEMDAAVAPLALEATVAVVDGVADEIKAKTDNLPSDPADASVISGRFDTLDTSVADLPTNAELATALSATLNANVVQVNNVTVNGTGTTLDPWGP